MLKPLKRWLIKEVDQEKIDLLAKQNAIHPIMARLLFLRGVTSDEEIALFLNSQVATFYDPFLLDGMSDAVQRIQAAITQQEKILIYGDYDADGVTSTALMYKTLKALNANLAYYIPNRFTDGYGLNSAAITKAATQGFKLILTVDTGISAVDEAELVKELGLNLIITDHHEPPETLPDAYAIINPKKTGDKYPFKALAGVGVAFKLAHALLGRPPIELLDLTTLGTIADLVPLVGENRLIVSQGLRQLAETTNLGLRLMLEQNGLIDKPITASHIGFIIAPRINASGRLENANHAVKLLITNSAAEAETTVKLLSELNQERQNLVEQITKEALELIEAQNLTNDRVLVIAKEGWNEGVIGIVAARILEKYYRPVIILSINSEENLAKGSARSIAGFDIYQALTSVKELLQSFGGHTAAAGLNIATSKIAFLRAELNELAEQWLSLEDYQPLVEVDLVCGINDLDVELLKQLERLAPFGIGNPSPKALVKEAIITEIKAIGKNNQHLKLKVSNSDKSLEAVVFKRGELLKELAPYSRVELLGELSINEWRGQQKPQLIVKDLQVPKVQVFDWRAENWSELFSVAGRESSLILFNYHQGLEALTKKSSGYKLAHYAELQQIEAFEVSELFLLHLPPDLDRLKALIKASANLARIYCIFADHQLVAATREKELFKKVYLLLKHSKQLSKKAIAERSLKDLGINSLTFHFILDVFAELGFIIVDGDQITLEQSPEKKQLADSALFRDYLERKALTQKINTIKHQELTSLLVV